jgi:hypothetical protein
LEEIIINKIRVAFNPKEHIKILGLSDDTEQSKIIQDMAGEATELASPKVMYRPSSINEAGEDFALVEGIKLESRVLAVNIEGIHIIFPFVASCGMELHEWGLKFDDPIQKDWARAICMQALYLAVGTLKQCITEKFGHENISMMNPGSIESWPLNEQEKIFSLLGDVTEKTGVVLEENMFMTPSMSASGFFSPNDKNYENCALCPNEDCPGRRAPYDKDMYERDYK